MTPRPSGTRSGCVGVLLAAGYSRRMGVTKQLLPWPPSQTPRVIDRGSTGTVVEASFDLLSLFCERIIVVLDHEAKSIRRALGGRSFTPLLGDGAAPMFESVRLGLRAAMGIDADAAVLLHPADHPAVAPTTVQRLLDAATRRTDQAVVPIYGDRGGHPILIPPPLCRVILNYDGDGGLRGLWQSRADACCRLPVDDPTVTMDIDTRAHYDALGAFVQ